MSDRKQTVDINTLPHRSGSVGVYHIPEGYLLPELRGATSTPCMQCGTKDFITHTLYIDPVGLIFSYAEGEVWNFSRIRCESSGEFMNGTIDPERKRGR